MGAIPIAVNTLPAIKVPKFSDTAATIQPTRKMRIQTRYTNLLPYKTAVGLTNTEPTPREIIKPPTRYDIVESDLWNSSFKDENPAAKMGVCPPPMKVWKPIIKKHKSLRHVGQLSGSFGLS